MNRLLHISLVAVRFGNGPMPKEWHPMLDRLIDDAILGDRLEVVRTLDTLVKGYTPDYAFHKNVTPAIPPPSKSIH